MAATMKVMASDKRLTRISPMSRMPRAGRSFSLYSSKLFLNLSNVDVSMSSAKMLLSAMGRASSSSRQHCAVEARRQGADIHSDRFGGGTEADSFGEGAAREAPTDIYRLKTSTSRLQGR